MNVIKFVPNKDQPVAGLVFGVRTHNSGDITVVNVGDDCSAEDAAVREVATRYNAAFKLWEIPSADAVTLAIARAKVAA